MDAKICGIKDSKTLNYIVNHNTPPKFIGFITNYSKSKRYVEYKNLKKLISIDKKKTNFVSVLVNPSDEVLEKINERFSNRRISSKSIKVTNKNAS